MRKREAGRKREEEGGREGGREEEGRPMGRKERVLISTTGV